MPFRQSGSGLWRFAVALIVTLGALCVVLTGPLDVASAQKSPGGTVQPGPGHTDPTPASSVLAAGPQPAVDSIRVLGQSAWVSDRQDYHLRLAVLANDPAHEQLDVVFYNRLTTRTGFDEALSGNVHGYSIYTLRLPVSTLPADPAGGVDIDIPVNPANEAPAGGIPPFYAVAGSAVFPVQIGLDNSSGVAQGAPVKTFMVYGDAPPVSGLPRLSVSLVVPIHAAPPVGDDGRIGALPRSQSVLLAKLVDTLWAHRGISSTLAITPETLEALDSTRRSDLDRSTLAYITAMVRAGNVEVVPATYATVPLRGWDAAGLDAELSNQLEAGSSVLAGLLGKAPSATTWVVNGSLDSAALRTLESSGATQFIVPDADLSVLPAVAEETTFAFPTRLDGAGGRAVVDGADAGLTAGFSNPGEPVLAASQLLAEMAMIQLEQPGKTRAVSVLAPPGWSANATFVDTLLVGLQGNPLLGAVTASGLFQAVPVFPLHRSLVAPPPADTGESGEQGTAGLTGLSAPATAATGPVGSGAIGTGLPATAAGGTGSTAPIGPAETGGAAPSGSVTPVAAGVTGDIGAELGPDVSSIMSVRRGLAGMVAVLPQQAKQVVVLNKELLTAESTDLTEAQRQGLLTQIQAAITKVTSLFTLPRSSSITLTSTRGAIPLTVLSTASVHARVQLRLSSERLIFHAFSPPNGSCTVPTSTSEVCELTLTTQNTTLKVPVEARASGVFPVDVSLWTPDGSELIAQGRDTIRSTAVSGVGVILILVAIISLGIWWVRDLRHGRRAGQLVPAPVDDAPDQDSEEEPGDAIVSPVPEARSQVHDGGLPVAADLPDPETMVRQIFSAPTPEYGDQASGTLS